MGGRVAGKVGFSNGGFSDGGKCHSQILTLIYLWYFHRNDFFDDTILFRRKNRMNVIFNEMHFAELQETVRIQALMKVSCGLQL